MAVYGPACVLMDDNSIEASGRKRQRKMVENLDIEEQDRLSQLPIDLVHHILSFLTMRDVIKTSVLSKCWRDVWSSVPCLNFFTRTNRSTEITFINRCLMLHSCSIIQKLSITFKYRYYYGGIRQVDSWIQFALKRDVKELYFDFFINRTANEISKHTLPGFLFGSRSLQVLVLKRCIINSPAEDFKLDCLQFLSLEQIELFDGTINSLISSSPRLEYLSLTNCNCRSAGGNFHLVILNRAMKTLKIYESGDYYSSSTLEVLAPYLNSFELTTNMQRKKYIIKTMIALESAKLDCTESHTSHPSNVPLDEEVATILHNLCRVKDLQLDRYYIQALAITEEQSRGFPSFGVTRLTIKTGLTKRELSGIAYMLRHSPNIQTLIITIAKVAGEMNDESNCKFNFKEGEFWELEEPNFINLLSNLKTVEIYDFAMNRNTIQSKRKVPTVEGFFELIQNDMNFLRFLLKNSKVLERVIIKTSENFKLGRSVKRKLTLPFLLIRKLLAFPRASRCVEISFTGKYYGVPLTFRTGFEREKCQSGRKKSQEDRDLRTLVGT